MSGYGRENDERRKVDRDSIERRILNYDPYEEGRGAEHEPDFEAIMEARAERHRPDWDDPRRY